MMSRSMVVRSMAFLLFRRRAQFFLCPAANLPNQARHTFLRDRRDFHIVVAEGDGKRIASAELLFLDRQPDALIARQTRQLARSCVRANSTCCANKTALSDFSTACWAWK